VIASADLPAPPKGYRIVTEAGAEFYGWADWISNT
jgi:hypothetical protein